MPARIDLTGKQFGKLVVVAEYLGPRPTRKSDTWWICRCECGHEIKAARTVLQPKRGTRNLPVTSCPQCAAKICAICGRKYSRSHPSRVCPRPECKAARSSEYSAAHYRKNREKALQRSAERHRNKTPEQRAADHARDRAYRQRLRETMDSEQFALWRARKNAAARDWYNRLKTERPEHYAMIQQARKLQREAMKADLEKLEARRAAFRKHARKLREELKDDPAALAVYREQMRGWRRDWYARTMADPVKRAKYRADEARRLNEREVGLFLADMQTILEESKNPHDR